jgi:hypothetical protein
MSLAFHYFHFIREYGQGFSYNSVSDSLFVVGIVFFFPALMAQMGSFKMFYGFQYAIRGLFSNDFRRRYRNFSDYLVEKGESIKTSIYTEVLLSTSVILIAAIIFGMLWDRSL